MSRNKLLEMLESLKDEHRTLDNEITAVTHIPFNQLRVQRLKKRKLQLRDRIIKLESELYPDIIA